MESSANRSGHLLEFFAAAGREHHHENGHPLRQPAHYFQGGAGQQRGEGGGHGLLRGVGRRGRDQVQVCYPAQAAQRRGRQLGEPEDIQPRRYRKSFSIGGFP